MFKKKSKDGSLKNAQTEYARMTYLMLGSFKFLPPKYIRFTSFTLKFQSLVLLLFFSLAKTVDFD